jgi:hypothetical protein
VCLSLKKYGKKRVSPEAVLAVLRGGISGVTSGGESGRGLTIKELVRNFEVEPGDVLTTVDSLVAAGTLAIDPTGIIRITKS